ncbi:MAG: murein biosynthesis integral membrane protein MurJ [Candidatus Berkelbacteria bacterium]
MVKKVAAILHRKNSLTAASVILMITLTLSNVLGLIRDHFLTQKIPTELLSAYYAAFRIPDLIFNILILGAITSAFIPIFTNLVAKEKEDEAWLVASSVVNIAFVFLVCFSIVLVLIMPIITPLVVPGFDSSRQEIVTNLARIMLLSPIFFGLSYIFGGILNSFKRFMVYSLAPLVYNITIILGTLFFADHFSVYGVAVSVVVGAFLHFLIQLPVAIKLGFRFNAKIAWDHWGVKRIGLLMIPRSIALGANQIMLLIFTGIASSLGGYSIAVYNLADNIQTMPMVVFGTSFATAIFPTLSEAVSRDRYDEFIAQIIKYTRIILFFMIPIIVMIVLLRIQIIRLIFGSGHFGWDQTMATANTTAYLALSLAFTGLQPLFSRAFYALHNTKVPMIGTMVGVVASIILGKILSLKLGVEGLALGYTIGSMIGTIFLYIMLKKHSAWPEEKGLFIFVLKVVVASVVMGLVIQLVKTLTGGLVDMHRFWGIAVQLILSAGVGLIVYLMFTKIFKFKEIEAVTIIWQKFTRRGASE